MHVAIVENYYSFMDRFRVQTIAAVIDDGIT